MVSPARTPAPSWSRLLALLYWTTPSLLCLILYWYGFRAWFRMDDFAWLGLHTLVDDFDSFLRAMFTPLAQGSIRPLSERLFFLAGWHLFGLEAPPFRAVVFATMFSCLVLLTAVTRRLTGSAVAGFLAPVLWLVNGNIYTPMSWTSGYNQILCAFSLLTALLLWIRYTETGERRFYAWQWVAFVVGFGALEINVVYPAIAGLHALCFARRYVVKTAPMFAVSAVYAVIHRLAAPEQKAETYRMYFDAGVIDTLRKYVQWSFGADRFAEYRGLSPIPFYAAEGVLILAMAAFTIAMVRKKQWLALFCTGWFFITIAPVLPLQRHISDYYLTIPVIGFCILGAWAVAAAWGTPLANARGSDSEPRPSEGVKYARTNHSLTVVAPQNQIVTEPRALASGSFHTFSGGSGVRWAAVALLLVYGIPSAWMAHGMSKQFHDESRRYSNFVRSVAYAHKEHPDKRLLIRGVDRTLFHGAWADNPFRIFGLSKVYMPAGAIAEFGADRHFMAESIALEGMKRNQVLVYDVKPDGRLRNVTPLVRGQWERTALPPPQSLDLRDPLSEVHLPNGWWQAEANHRWMSGRASVRLGGPSAPSGELTLRGRALHPAVLTVSVNGRALPPSTVRPGSFELKFPADRAQTLNVVLEVDRTVTVPGDGRELGLMFTSIEVAP